MARAERKGDGLKERSPECSNTQGFGSNVKCEASDMEHSKSALTDNQSGGQSTFEFDGHQVRAVVDGEGNPWFVARDVCKALAIAHAASALRSLDPDEKGVHSMHTPGGAQEVSVVSESGMYTLMLRCRDAVKPGTVPHRFRKWVTGEVLPTLRKTGHYGVDEGRLNEAFMLASEVAQQAARTVFESVMSGEGNWQLDRWLFSFTTDPEGNLKPFASVLDRKALPVSMERLAEMITMPGGLCPSQKELAVVAEACTKRLSEIIDYQNRKRLAGGVA